MSRRLGFYRFATTNTILVVLLMLPKMVWAATYIINSPTDEASDGACTAPYANSANDCTIRDAIALANSGGGADTINFSIDNSFQSDPTYYNNGQFTITVGSVLDSLSGQTTLSATSTWDSTNNRPGIRLYSSSAVIDGITADTGSSNSSISGLEIEGFAKAINILVDSVTVGTNCDGVTDTQERNVLHGNGYGVYITRANSVVAGNYIGVASNGTTPAYETNGDVWIDGATADSNTVGFREGTTGNCSAATQRNVLAGTTGASSSLVYIFGIGNTALGDIATGANNNYVSGNYIGTDSTGTVDLSGKVQNSATGNIGVRLSHGAIYNWIGTDGDGIDDQYEGNVINAAVTGVSTSAITVNVTGTNRISGNYIGVQTNGTSVLGNSMTVGIVLQGSDNIVGWCDVSDNATLCSNNGTVATQRNILGGASSDQIRFGVSGSGSYIYGNYIGVGADGTSDVSNAIGIFIHRSSHDGIIGGTGNRANTVQHNTIGIKPDGDFSGNRTSGASQNPITNTYITNNLISLNDSSGIQLYWTENFGTSSITVNNNSITNNGGVGIDAFGSSPTITNNTIQNNSSYGIYVRPAFTKRNVTGWHANEAAESFDPANASTNILAAPTITSNTISNNGDDGIYQFDSRAANYTTLVSSNTISANNNQPAVTQAWYGAIEVLDRNNTPIPSSSWSGTVATATGATAGNNFSSAAASSAGGADMIFGPATVSYSNVSTWFTVVDYSISDTGVTTSYNPYTITETGTYSDTSGKMYTFDGTNNDTTYSGVLANGITTGSLYRFQIAKGVSSTVPATPTNITPTNGSTTSNLTPILTASAFSDSVETHTSSSWRLYSSESLCTAGGTGDVYSTTSTSNLTALPIPNNTLTQASTYYWRVAYTNSFNNQSAYSSCTSFTTIRTTPTLLSSIPDVTWDEDDRTTNSYDLDDYFSDAEAETLTYVIDLSDTNNVTITLDQTSHHVSFSSAANWFGNATLQIIACDTDNECITSNTSTLTVTSINDRPTAPATGFSPDNTTVTTLTPALRWSAATDTEDDVAVLYYEIWLGQNSAVTQDPEYTLTSAIGATSLTLTDALDDHSLYYYAIRTIDTTGSASDWSTIQSFHIDTTTITAQPTISLTKSVGIVASDLSAITAAATTGYWPTLKFILQQFSLAALIVCSAIVLWSITGLARRLPTVTHVLTVAVQQPALAFATLTTQDRSGNYHASYSTFSNQVVPLRRALHYGIMAALIFTGLHLAVRTLASSATEIAPGDTVRYTINYDNSGSGSATNAILYDALPANVSLQTDSLIINRGGATQALDAGTVVVGQRLTVTLSSIPADSSGSVQYDVVVHNPIDTAILQAAGASLAATELDDQTVESNSVSLDIVSATATIAIRTSSGLPINQATLSLYQNSILDSALVWTTTTNDTGSAELTGLRAGTYWLTIAADGYSTIDPQVIELHYNRTTDTIVILSLIDSGTPTQPITNSNSINSNTVTPTTNTNTPANVNNLEHIPTIINSNSSPANTNQTNTTPPNTTPIIIPIIGVALPTTVTTVAHAITTAVQTIIATPPGAVLVHTAQTLGILSWSIAAASEVILATTTITSLADLYLIVARFFGALFGLRKKRQPWGVVYDAVTKRPLDPAYVSLHSSTNEVVKDGITDLDGRYEFFLPPNTYRVTANKTHYQFPSKHLHGKTHDVLYDNLYFGEKFTTSTGEVITRNIPLDPVAFDWNEFEKNKEHQFRFYHSRRRITRWLGYSGYWLGFGLTLVLCLAQPHWFNFTILAIYFAISLYHLLWFPKRRAVRLQYRSGEPIPFAIIRVYSARLRREMKSTVTDEYGRFYLLLEPGKYYWTVEIHQPDDSYRLIYTSEPVHLKNGVIQKNIVVPEIDSPA